MVSSVQFLDPREETILSRDSLQLCWYAAYTRANHEKRVRDQLEQRSVESFLPLYGTSRRWKDRWMRLEMPLFPGYVFVRMVLAGPFAGVASSQRRTSRRFQRTPVAVA